MILRVVRRALARHCLLVGLCAVVPGLPAWAESPEATEATEADVPDKPSLFNRLFRNPAKAMTPEIPVTAGQLLVPVAPLEVHELASPPAVRNAIDLTSPPDDLWVRVRNGFAMADLNDDLVLYYQQWYQNRPDALRRMVERSRPYLHHIVEEIETRGMPTELALLPMVESSFNPMAYSRAHASGLWQFVPATGKRFNLEQNWWHDQRRDIVASTGAALDYLQTIYEMHGDWHLALASYNWGEGAVKRAIEKNMARGLATDYSSLTMPNETRHYVPKLQALKNVFGNPVLMRRLGLPEIINRPYFARVEMERPVDIKTAARLANMPLQDFVALNPAHNRPVIQGYTPMVIPAEKLETFQNNLESNTGPLTAWQAYTLKPGERLDKLAPRFGITLADLQRVNGLQGRIRLGSGTTVLVPSGRGGADLDDLPAPPAVPLVAEPEPVRTPVKAVARNGKDGKEPRGGKDRQAKAGKPAAKAAPSGKAKTDKPATAKAAAGNGGKPSPKARNLRRG